MALYTEPHVATWWPEPNKYTDFEDKWLKKITERAEKQNSSHGYIIMINNISIGYIQYYLNYKVTTKNCSHYPPLPKHTVGIDLFIGDRTYLGKKLSTPIITTFIETIIKNQKPETAVIIMDPAPTNQRAIHVYTKAGFKKIGLFQQSHGPVLLMYKKNCS